MLLGALERVKALHALHVLAHLFAAHELVLATHHLVEPSKSDDGAAIVSEPLNQTGHVTRHDLLGVLHRPVCGHVHATRHLQQVGEVALVQMVLVGDAGEIVGYVGDLLSGARRRYRAALGEALYWAALGFSCFGAGG